MNKIQNICRNSHGRTMRRGRSTYAKRGHMSLACLMGLAIAASATLQAWGLDPALPPSGNFNLSHWYLGLPVDSSGGTNGSSASVSTAALLGGYEHPDYFYTDTDGSMVFWAPVTGVTTPGSSFPRSELRELISPPSTAINWSAYGVHTLSAQCKVTQVPSSGEVIIGQIHSKTGEARPLVKLQYINGAIAADIKQSPTAQPDLTLVFGCVGLNTIIDYTIHMEDGLVTVTVNGISKSMDVFANDPDWANQEFYFKAGSYCQDNEGDSSEGARVAFYTLTTLHQPAVDLTVVSPYGTPIPAVGTARYGYDTLVNAAMPDSPVLNGSTRHTVTGWTGTGDVITGVGTNTSFNLTQDSSITWQWLTEHWLNTAVTVGGSVNVADGWFNAGSVVQITATSEPGYYFSNWTGDSSSTIPVQNVTMSAPKSLTAVFVRIGPPPTLAERGVLAVSASDYHEVNIPENTLDGLLSTHWSAEGDGQWIAYDLGVAQDIYELRIAWHNGDTHSASFDVQMSLDGLVWDTVASSLTSSGSTTALETYDIPDTNGRYVRIVGHGNSIDDWNRITEVEIWGTPAELPAEVYLPAMDLSGGDVQFIMPSVYGALYQLQRSDTLTPVAWEDSGARLIGDGNDLYLSDPVALASNRFYRLFIQP